MNLLNISCKKATYLLSKKEENKLSWLDRVKLRSHLTICSLCRKFEQQTSFIGFITKHGHEQAVLSVEAKEKMKTVLKD